MGGEADEVRPGGAGCSTRASASGSTRTGGRRTGTAAVGSCVVRGEAGRRLDVAPDQVVWTGRAPNVNRPHGKVRVVGADLSVSVSHFGDWVLVAESVAGPVGVDVEDRPGRRRPGAGGAGSAPGRGGDADPDRAVRPGRGVRPYWTRKEAVLKTTGDGLRTAPDAVLLSGPDEPAAVRAWPDRPELVERLWLADVAVGDGYAAAVAVVADASSAPRVVRPRPAAEVLGALE